MNKQELASKIWDSANKMRKNIQSSEYQDYILGFMFYKFLSEKEITYLKSKGSNDEELKIILQEKNKEEVEDIKVHIGYFISYDNLFSTWIQKERNFSISDVRDALSAFERLVHDDYKNLFEGIFSTLETGLSKMGSKEIEQTKVARDLINIINDIPMIGKQSYDVLGFIYEDLLKNFALDAAAKAGEFYTPHEVSLLMSEIISNHLKDKKNITIMDTTSGSASLLLNIGKVASKYIEKNGIKYYAQESNPKTYNLTRMNLIMRGILPNNIVTKNADTLAEDWPIDPNNSYKSLLVDASVSNPPYSQPWDTENKDNDSRFAPYGIAPKTKADYAFLLHDLYHIKPDGIMAIVMPHGVLFRGGEEEKIRQNLIEKNQIDTIIGLPANIFYVTAIPTTIIILKKQRKDSDVLVIDASKGFIKDGKKNKLRTQDIRKIVDTVINRKNIDKFSRVVSKEEIKENEYNLNISRYVDSSEAPETYDIHALMFGGIPEHELEYLNKYWRTFPGLKNKLFKQTSEANLNVRDIDIKETILNHDSVKDFYKKYNKSLSGFDKTMENDLIQNMESVNLRQEEEKLTNDLFERFKKIDLIDKYKVYQRLSDLWTNTSLDLEAIQENGKSIITEVAVKEKSSKNTKVQDGYEGKIIPFALIQETILKECSDALKENEEKLDFVINQQLEIFESLTEEDKDQLTNILNNDKTAFNSAALNRKAKEYLKDNSKENYDEDSIEYKVISTAELSEQEKDIKQEIKDMQGKLQLKTKKTIENLTDEQAQEMLKQKWISPLVMSFKDVYEETIDEFTEKIENLNDKYSETYSDIEESISDINNELIGYIDQLVGSETDMEGLQEFKKLLGSK